MRDTMYCNMLYLIILYRYKLDDKCVETSIVYRTLHFIQAVSANYSIAAITIIRY